MSLKNILIVIIISFAVSTATVYLYDRYKAPRIVTVDLSKSLVELKKEFVSGEISKEALEEKFKAIQQKIDEIPDRYIVLKDEAVLKNGKKISLIPQKGGGSNAEE